MFTDVVALLQQLVRIPSVNPDSHPGTDCSNLGEEKIARHVGALLGQLGAEVRFDDVQPGRPNVIGRFSCRGIPKAKVLLAPHLDTVGVGGMTIDPFEGEIADGRVYGRGACDTKGTMAAMLAALAEVHSRLPDFSTEITFVGLMGEETGQPGSIDFARRYAGEYDFALVGEPTNCQVVHAHKGCTWIDLASCGRACHASTPELGDNAIVTAARLVVALDGKFRQYLADHFTDPVLGAPSINPGEIHGGTRPNIVPDRATLTIDIRTTPALTDADPVKVLADFLDRELGDRSIHIYERFSTRPLHTPADHPMVRRLLESTGSSLATAPWFCDAAHLAAGGIPAVAAGPGSIDQAHTVDEWISIQALEEGVAFYRKFLESLA